MGRWGLSIFWGSWVQYCNKIGDEAKEAFDIELSGEALESLKYKL